MIAKAFVAKSMQVCAGRSIPAARREDAIEPPAPFLLALARENQPAKGDFECNGDVSTGTARQETKRGLLRYHLPIMQLDSVGDVIAVRKFSLANDPSREIVLKMGKPQPLPDALGDDHYCPFQIIGVGKEKVKYAAGVDAFQSIELVVRIIGAELASLNRELDGQLRWEGDEQGDLGFPTS